MKRGNILTAFFTLIIATGFVAGQSVVKESRDIEGFKKVSFGVAGNLYVELGKEFKVVLEGDEDLLDEIITEVKGDRLIIKKESWHFTYNERVKAYITMPEIQELQVSGSGRAEIMDALKTENLNLGVSGSGKLYTAEVIVSHLNCNISGSGDIILGGGSAEASDLTISGSGNFTGESTKIGQAGVSISGSGNCNCNITGTLKGNISGSGNVTYLGDPKVDVRVSGSGKFRSK